MSTERPKYRVTHIPLASSLLPNILTADPASVRTTNQTDGKSTFVPSSLRRNRLVDTNVHFSYVRPLVIGFPYDIQFPENGTHGVDKAAFIEDWLRNREPSVPVGDLLVPEEQNVGGKRLLLSISPSALSNLDPGNASLLLYPSGGPSSSLPAPDEAANDIFDVLGGVAIRKDFEPYAMRYSGHQFGSWAGQLGDGRATTVLATNDGTTDIEVQLKGCGRTPFSRSADGLAVTRSSIREYLCSEYMHALGIPTTRALSLISLPDVPVFRERRERASVVARTAPSFIRIGNFQAFNSSEGGDGMMWFGGGQQKRDLQGLRVLGEYVSESILGVREGDGLWAEKLVREVAERNGKMIAHWQSYGFMHGVLNTDNVSILGLTIDYGPFAFMDVFDPFHICNHSDDAGRYMYRRQPEMIIYAVSALLRSLAPLIGYEKKFNKAFPAGSDDLDIPGLTELGMSILPEVEARIQSVTSETYGKLMALRLGLKENDEAGVTRPLLDLMQERGWDFHETFRKLSTGQPLPDQLEEGSEVGKNVKEWIDKWTTRATERDSMTRANPRFVLRQWVLEEVIKAVEADLEEPERRFDGRKKLAKVLEMSQKPFSAWGGEGKASGELSEEEKEERRLCGVGGQDMLGFQCSCSS